MAIIKLMKIGILLSTHPDRKDGERVRSITDAALAAEDEIYLYLLDEGARFLTQEWVHALVDRGATVYTCAYAAQNRRLSDPGKTTFCGLVVLTQIMEGCDRFLAFA
jgi:hypothetical protein